MRDCKGNIQMLGAKSLLKGINNEANAQATLLVIEMGIKYKMIKLHLIGNSHIIDNDIIKVELGVWYLNINICRFRSILESFKESKVTHVRCEANETANTMSKVMEVYFRVI